MRVFERSLMSPGGGGTKVTGERILLMSNLKAGEFKWPPYTYPHQTLSSWLLFPWHTLSWNAPVTAGSVHISFLCDPTAYWVRGHLCTDSFSNQGQPFSPPNTCVDGMPFKVQAFSCFFMIFESLDSNSWRQKSIVQKSISWLGFHTYLHEFCAKLCLGFFF